MQENKEERIMKQIKLEINIEACHYDELTEKDRKLIDAACEATKRSYAPYSHFAVGAAALLENDIVITGTNQENAAYPSGLCAERVAIFYAGANYPGVRINKIAITAASDTNPTTEPIPPCGACRQSIAEYEIKQEQPIEIYFMGETGVIYQSDSLKNLLPFMFNKKFL